MTRTPGSTHSGDSWIGRNFRKMTIRIRSRFNRLLLSTGLAFTVAASALPAYAAQTPVTSPASTGTAITAQINGKPAEWGARVYTYHSLTYVPVREGAVSLGAKVKWDKSRRAAVVTLNGDELLYQPGADHVLVNGFELKMPGSTRYVDGVLTVPLRGLTEPLRADIQLNSGSSTRLSLTTDTATQMGTSTNLQAVDNYLKKEQYSGNVLVAKDGEVLMRKGYGLASDTKLIRPTDLMRLGSLTKAFTAASILKLEEEGKLSTEDSLSKFIPDYPRGDEIKLSMLLSHTSGIALNFKREDGIPLADTVAEIKASSLKFQPGTSYKYSNSGYVLLAFIIEQTSGMSYPDYVRTQILEPLGMSHSGTVTRNTPVQRGYEYDWQQRFWKAVDYYFFSPSGTGSLYSTVDDMLTWSEALSDGKVLSEETLERMYTPNAFTPYAYAWGVSGEGDNKVAYHNGGGDGYTTGIRRGLNDGTVVILLGNHGGLDTNKMTLDIRKLVFGK
ncbi:hypothetical protein B9G55_02665 [Saccharibacillus sp. O16]|nr:hypothetical protein B9G55_02665 [Saccharibacillus sp. O16]